MTLSSQELAQPLWTKSEVVVRYIFLPVVSAHHFINAFDEFNFSDDIFGFIDPKFMQFCLFNLERNGTFGSLHHVSNVERYLPHVVDRWNWNLLCVYCRNGSCNEVLLTENS
jgi:hypothetical protein